MPELVNENKCPFCKEVIAAKAKVCRHCHSEIPQKKKSPLKKLNTFRVGFLSGLLFMIILWVLFEMYRFGN